MKFLKKTRGCTRLADMLPSKYKDNTLQIKEKSTKRTAPFFVLEVTARSAADILGIQPNSAILFYRKILKADVVAVRQEKWLSSAF